MDRRMLFVTMRVLWRMLQDRNLHYRRSTMQLLITKSERVWQQDRYVSSTNLEKQTSVTCWPNSYHHQNTRLVAPRSCTNDSSGQRFSPTWFPLVLMPKSCVEIRVTKQESTLIALGGLFNSRHEDDQNIYIYDFTIYHSYSKFRAMRAWEMVMGLVRSI